MEKDGIWGDFTCMQVISYIYKCNILIYDIKSSNVKVLYYKARYMPDDPSIHLCHHRASAEHFNAVKNKGSSSRRRGPVKLTAENI